LPEQEGPATNKPLRNIAIAVVVIVIGLIALPMFINVNTFKPKIESELGSVLGRKVEVGNLSLSILGRSVSARDISIADDPAFSTSPFLTAKSLKIGVHLMPLIFSKQLRVTGITFDEPSINVVINPQGARNFQSLGRTVSRSGMPPSGAAGSKSTTSGGGGVAFSVAELKVNDGKLIIGRTNSPAAPLSVEKVNINVKNFSATSQFPFTLSALLANHGKLNLKGTAGPLAASGTPVEAALKISAVDLAAVGMDPSIGLGGTANLDGTLHSDGKNAKIDGTLTLDKVKLSPKGKPAPKRVTVKFATAYNVASESGTLSQGDILLGKAVVRLTGTYESPGQAMVLNLKLEAPGLPVDEIESILPAIGVALPAGSGLKGGTLSTSLSISGPLDKLVIAGPVRLVNSSLTGFDLGGKLGALSALSGKTVSSKNTTINMGSLDAHVTPKGSNLNSINVNVTGIGTISGSGAISEEGALNFHMVAHLGGAVGEVTKVAGLGSHGIPFMIEGTTSDPKFVADVAGMAGSAVEGVIKDTKKPTNALHRLFKKP
jgi:AsmA protein